MKHTHLTDDLQEKASLYVAGAMTDNERDEYVHHLEDDNCAVCSAEVKELQSAISLLAFAAPPAVPSSRVKDRLMEQARTSSRITEKPRSAFSWLQWATTAVALTSIIAAFVVIRRNNELQQLANELNSKIARLEVQLAEQQNTVAMLTSPRVRVIGLAGQGTNVGASGKIFWNQAAKNWAFYVRDLPPAPPGSVYQLWFVPQKGNPVSAGIFETQANGDGEVQRIPVPDNIGELKAAAVTIERAPGVLQPMGPFALLGAL